MKITALLMLPVLLFLSMMSLFAAPPVVAGFAALSLGLYILLGRALWTLMFLTERDSSCMLQRMMKSEAGVPWTIYLTFMTLWPVMLAMPLLRGELLLGRSAPAPHATSSPIMNPSFVQPPVGAGPQPMRP